jgi:hypothetical protein
VRNAAFMPGHFVGLMASIGACGYLPRSSVWRLGCARRTALEGQFGTPPLLYPTVVHKCVRTCLAMM